MLYLEELLDAIIAEEGQTLMGLEFLIETLGLSMKRIDTLFFSFWQSVSSCAYTLTAASLSF